MYTAEKGDKGRDQRCEVDFTDKTHLMHSQKKIIFIFFFILSVM